MQVDYIDNSILVIYWQGKNDTHSLSIIPYRDVR